MKKLKGIDGKLDEVWSELVKLRAGMKCEYCGINRNLNSHHIYSRSKKSVRWSLINGICLCVSHHTFSSTFSAHKTPLEFTDWLYQYKDDNEMVLLRIKANQTSKMYAFEKEILLEELKKEIKNIKESNES